MILKVKRKTKKKAQKRISKKMVYDEVLEQIKKYDSIVIYGHKNPDGDCYGAQVGLREIILGLYPHKKVYITGTGCPRFFTILPEMDVVSDEVIANSLAFLVDANDLNRMEDQRIHTAPAFAKIDHHIDNFLFTEGPQVINTTANSTCDLITELAMLTGVELSVIGATALYLGVVSDSANFKFVTNYVETFERVKYLAECGARIHELNFLLSKTNENSLKAKGYILANYKKTKGGVVYIVHSKEKLHKLHLSANEASNLVNLLGNIDGCPIWVSFAEYEDGRVRLEIRSNGPEIQPCAVRVGGGGHAQASGAQLPELNYDVVQDILDDLDKTLKEWRKTNHVGK